MDRRRSLDPIKTETHIYLGVRIHQVQPLIAAREAQGWRVRHIVRDSSRSWLVVYEMSL
jgi:hypothetical protein